MLAQSVRLVLFTDRSAAVLRLLRGWMPAEVAVRAECGPRTLQLELSGPEADPIADAIRDWFDAGFRRMHGGAP